MISGWRPFPSGSGPSFRPIQLRPGLRLAIAEARQRYLQEVIAPARPLADGQTTATGGQAMQRSSNDEAGHGLSSVGDG